MYNQDENIEIKDEIFTLLQEKQKEVQKLVALYYVDFLGMGLPEVFVRELTRNYHTTLVSFMLDTFIEVDYESKD